MLKRTFAEWVIYWIILVVLLLPTVPISMAWNRLRRTAGGMGAVNRWILFALAVQSISVLHIAVCMAYSNAIGRQYSNIRYSLIYTWIFVLALTLLATKPKSQIRSLLMVGTAGLLWDWFYILAISSVV
jgi:hypothetical protein